MELVNGTKFGLKAAQALDQRGDPWLVVVAKATYEIPFASDAVPVLAANQREILSTDIFEREPGLSSPLIESDMVPTKPLCDVIIKGSAHAPHGRAVTELIAGFTLGPIRKQIRVIGDRYWIKGVLGYRPSKPKPFVEMPITYGRAFGGMFDGRAIGSNDPNDFLAHPANLVGCGYARAQFKDLVDGRPVPNLEAIADPIEDPERLHTPVSLGPVARSWAPRIAYQGTYDRRWQDEVFPLLPADFDDRYYQCAPADQQMPYPAGGEEVVLLSLTKGSGLTRFRLPEMSLPMIALSKRRKLTKLEPVVDTLVIDTDSGTFDLVWRARMPLQRSLHEVHTVAVGSVCKRWWQSRVFGTEDCGCGGIETDKESLAPVTEGVD